MTIDDALWIKNLAKRIDAFRMANTNLRGSSMDEALYEIEMNLHFLLKGRSLDDEIRSYLTVSVIDADVSSWEFGESEEAGISAIAENVNHCLFVWIKLIDFPFIDRACFLGTVFL